MKPNREKKTTNENPTKKNKIKTILFDSDYKIKIKSAQLKTYFLRNETKIISQQNKTKINDLVIPDGSQTLFPSPPTLASLFASLLAKRIKI
jgi:hypothetical protein